MDCDMCLEDLNESKRKCVECKKILCKNCQDKCDRCWMVLCIFCATLTKCNKFPGQQHEKTKPRADTCALCLAKRENKGRNSQCRRI